MDEGVQVGAWIAALPFKVPFDLEELMTNPVNPPKEVNEKDELVGEFTEDEKIAWTLMERFNEVSERVRVDFSYARSDEQRSTAEMDFYANREKADVVRAIFWCMIRENRGLWVGNIGVRSGFKIVKSEEGDAMASLLEALAGHRH